MHELALCQAIVDTVERHAGGRRVEQVDVRIGHFRQVVPDSLQFSWELLDGGNRPGRLPARRRPRPGRRRVPGLRGDHDAGRADPGLLVAARAAT